ncbi:hypothetical protein ACFLYD_05975 [Chloroflexota bacterium]
MYLDDYAVVKREFDLRIADAQEWGRARDLLAQAKPQQEGWLTQQASRLRCELDFQRIVLAERLQRFRLAQSLLFADRVHLLSSGECR